MDKTALSLPRARYSNPEGVLAGFLIAAAGEVDDHGHSVFHQLTATIDLCPRFGGLSVDYIHDICHRHTSHHKYVHKRK